MIKRLKYLIVLSTIIGSVVLFNGCSEKATKREEKTEEKAKTEENKFDPFKDININISGVEGNPIIELDTSGCDASILDNGKFTCYAGTDNVLNGDELRVDYIMEKPQVDTFSKKYQISGLYKLAGEISEDNMIELNNDLKETLEYLYEVQDVDFTNLFRSQPDNWTDNEENDITGEGLEYDTEIVFCEGYFCNTKDDKSRIIGNSYIALFEVRVTATVVEVYNSNWEIGDSRTFKGYVGISTMNIGIDNSGELVFSTAPETLQHWDEINEDIYYGIDDLNILPFRAIRVIENLYFERDSSDLEDNDGEEVYIGDIGVIEQDIYFDYMKNGIRNWITKLSDMEIVQEYK